jgi:uncharacterized protein
MILYLGSSSLIALYAHEPQSDEIRSWVRVTEIVATCRIAYTEVISALDSRFRKGDISADDYERAVAAFNKDWEHLVTIDFDDREAGRFVKQYGLTRFGALHLSSARLIASEYEKLRRGRKGQGGSYLPLSLFFSSTDKTLVGAASAEGLKILPSA